VTEKVDSVEAYRKELDKLNHKISMAIGKITNRNHRMRQFLSKQQTKTSGKLLSVPVLSPLSEHEDEIFFHPEDSLGDDDIEYLFGSQRDEELGETKVEDPNHADTVLTPEEMGEIYRKDSPPHPFLQLVGISKMRDEECPDTQPNTESFPGNSGSADSGDVVTENGGATGGNSVGDLGMGDGSGSVAQLSVESLEQGGLSVANDSTNSSLHKSFASLKSPGKSVRVLSDRVMHGASTGVTTGMKRVSGGVKHVKKATNVGMHAAAKVADKGFSTAKKAAEKGVSKLHHAPELAYKLKESAAFIAPALAGKEDGGPRNAGFVVFSGLFPCQAARQMLQHQKGEK